MQWLKNLLSAERPFFFAVPLFLWQILFFYIPLLFTGIISILVYNDTMGYYQLTLARYMPFLSSTYVYILLKSFILATVNGILCFIVGYPLAYFLAFRTGRFKLFFLFLLILPFWTNFLLHVYAWFFVLDRGGVINMVLMSLGIIKEPLLILNSIFAIILLMLYCYLPFMVLPIYAVLERFDYTLFDASHDLGASHFETWYHVMLPISMTGVITGFFLVFVPSFGEFAIPGLMGGEKYLFAGSVIAQYALGHGTMEYATAFTVMSFIVLALCTIVGYGIARIIYRMSGVKRGS